MSTFTELSYLFLTNDLSVMFFTFLAAGMLCRAFPKKEHLVLRILALWLFGFFWSILTNRFLEVVCWPVDPYVEIPLQGLPAMMVKYIVYFMMIFVGIGVCFRCSGYTVLYCAALSYCVQHIGEKAWEIVEDFFVQLPDLSRLMVKYGYILLVFLFIWIFVLRKLVLETDETLRENRMVLQISVALILLDIVLGSLSTRVFLANSDLNVKLLDNIYSLLANLLVLFLITIFLRMVGSQREVEMVKRIQQERETQYRHDQVAREVLNVKCHDLKYQLSLLEKKMDAEELDQLQKVVQDYDTSVETGQPALDMVLSNEQLICNGKQIAFTVQADGKALDFMTEVDIYTLFGNLLDNAIEAVDPLEEDQGRIISLTIQRKNGFVFIHEENYYEGEVTLKNGLPLTRKEEQNDHGFGSRSIQTIVHKYQGQLKIQAKEGIYTLDIILPAEQAE